MTRSSWKRGRRVAAAAGVLSVLVAIAGAVIFAPRVGMPDGWWPHTGRAFATSTRAAQRDPCALIVGPGKAYCARGATSFSASPESRGVTGAAWRLAATGAGTAALVVWRLRSAAGQGRR